MIGLALGYASCHVDQRLFPDDEADWAEKVVEVNANVQASE
jgi:hypothetical protein